MYRIVKKILHPFDNWHPIELYILQVLSDTEDYWYTLKVSNTMEDIRPLCIGENMQKALRNFEV